MSREGGPGFWVGLLFGGIIGAGAALLFAPQAGGETREQIMGKGEVVRARADEVRARARETAGQMMARGRAAVEEKTGMVRSAVNEGRTEGERTAAELREELERSRRTGGTTGEA